MRLLSVTEAAKELNVTPATIYLWCRQNKIKHIRHGKTIRIKYDDLFATSGLSNVEA